MKNFKSVLSIILIIFTIVFLYVYYLSRNEDKNIVEDILISKPEIIFEEIKFDESNEFYDIKAKYPKDSRDKNNIIEENIKSIIKQKQEEWKIGGDLYNQEKDLSSKYSDRPIIKYELNIQYDKAFSEKYNIATYIFKIYEFTGGAHGNTSLIIYAFDENDVVNIDKYLKLSESDNAVKLTKILRGKLKKNLGEYVNIEMLDQGLGLAYLRPDGSFDNVKCKCDGFFFESNFKNFVIDDEGIKFIFGQYQVAPYAAGQPEVLLTWEELSDYIVK